MHYHLLIDADDTLWENNIYYEQAVHSFIAFLNHPRLSEAEVRGVLNEVEHGAGYGSASFTNSLLETYRRLTEKQILGEDLDQVREFGESVVKHPIELMKGVADTLEYLSPRHDLVLLTKGDVAEQNLKIERSGLGELFRETVVVPEKDVAAYHRVVREVQVDPKRTWMIGNSPRSDINPALAAGLMAVFIPHAHTWQLEHEDVPETADGRLLRLSSFSDLRKYF